MNKKGEGIGNLIFFFLIIGVVIVAGLFIVYIAGVLNMVGDLVVPEIKSIGMVGETNLTDVAEYSIDPVNTVIQNFTWFGGVAYFLAIIGLFGLAFTFRVSKMKILIVVFIGFAILMILASIVVSNIYEDTYNNMGDFEEYLHEQTLMSWLLIESPMIFSVVIFICGIIMFTGIGEEDFY